MPIFSNQDSISLSFVGASGHPELGLRSSGTTENDRDSKTVGGVRPVGFAYYVNLTVYSVSLALMMVFRSRK